MNAATPLDVLLKYDRQVPRYTSYPPAPHFRQDPEALGAMEMVDESNHVGPRNASFYFHIPFCPRRCHFCGCHTEIGRSGAFVREYLSDLRAETERLIPHVDRTRPVTQIHFGGGTPNAVPFGALESLLDLIRERLAVEPGAEIAMECDPNLMNPDRVRELARMGVTRISFGIQDFDPRVLAAVNRRFPRTGPKALFRACRDAGMRGNNLDLIYGLPHQTPAGFRDTVARAVDADPDRISLFPYAHVPWIKGHQSVLEGLPMPDAPARLAMAWESREALERAGYGAIGMDHFAKPGDELAAAARDGALHRNFQGYCHAGRAGQVYALGASAISQLHQGYLQNAKDLGEYRALVDSGRPAWTGGYRMRPEDLAVRAILDGLLCAGSADLVSAFDEAGVSPEWTTGYLAGCMERVLPFLADGLVAWEGRRVRLVGNGRYVSRIVAAAFDPMLAAPADADAAPRYSRAL